MCKSEILSSSLLFPFVYMLLLCSFPLSPLLFLGPRTTPFSPFSQHLNSMAQKRMRECEERDLTPPTAFNSILFSQLMFWKQFSRFSLHSPVHTDIRIHTHTHEQSRQTRFSQINANYYEIYVSIFGLQNLLLLKIYHAVLSSSCFVNF